MHCIILPGHIYTVDWYGFGHITRENKNIERRGIRIFFFFLNILHRTFFDIKVVNALHLLQMFNPAYYGLDNAEAEVVNSYLSR